PLSTNEYSAMYKRTGARGQARGHPSVSVAGFAVAETRRAQSPVESSPVLDPKVFKAYDVRGLYPGELDEEGAYAIGRAYVDQFEPRKIAVGRDTRVSSPAMAEAAMRGAADAGADVLDIGLVGTEMLYYAVGEL